MTNKEQDALACRALMQGMLVGSVIKMHEESIGLKIIDINQAVDEQGLYEQYFIVTLESGMKLRVSVEVANGENV